MKIPIECPIFGPAIVSATEAKKRRNNEILNSLNLISFTVTQNSIFAKDTALNNMLALHKFYTIGKPFWWCLIQRETWPHYTERYEHFLTYFRSKQNYATF